MKAGCLRRNGSGRGGSGPLARRLAARRRRHREAELAAALPELLERVAGELRAGAAPLAAMAGAADGPDLPEGLSADLARVIERAEEEGVGVALSGWAAERPLPAVNAAAAALMVAVEAGGPAVPALDGLAAGLRDRHDVVQEVAALSAQARMSALVVGAAPVVSLGLSLVADPRVARTLAGTAPGRACLLAGTALEGLAALWIRRIVRCEP
jgi:tight adherence protein B